MTPRRTGRDHGRRLRSLAVFEIAFLIAYRFGNSTSQQFASPLWFPDSVLLSALLVSERRSWWLYVLGALPIRLLLFNDPGIPLWFLIVSFANDSLKALLSAWLLSFLSRAPEWFESLREFVRYFLIAVVLSPMLSAFAGAASRVYLGDAFWNAWRNWFLGDALASLILTPFLVVMISALRKAGIDTVGRLTEGLLAAAGLMITGYLSFEGGVGLGLAAVLPYLPVPFLLWWAVRFGAAGAPFSLLMISLPAILGTLAGRGPFHSHSAPDSLLSIQLFLFVVSVPFMFLSVLISQQRRTDGALRESEERFRSLVDAGPVMVWMSGLDGLCTFFNKPWLDFTGRSMASELGNGWAEGVHREDRDNCVKQYLSAFQARKAFTLDYRLLRHDGFYRWVVHRGTPRFAPDGSFLGYVGSCIDITDRKEAEDKLRQFSIQIIRAQETERARIAQELHDDLSQRTAMISIGLHSISRKCGDNGGLREKVDELQRSAIDLGRDIARVAHQLHPGIVEKVGLLPSLRALCRQVSDSERAAEFVCDQELPQFGAEVAVSLYRIAQESLRNAITHGAATQVSIEVRETGPTIELSVKDNGCGFAVGSAPTPGMGLSGMADRMQSVGGALSILSAPGKGTTIIAVVPTAKALKAAN